MRDAPVHPLQAPVVRTGPGEGSPGLQVPGLELPVARYLRDSEGPACLTDLPREADRRQVDRVSTGVRLELSRRGRIARPLCVPHRVSLDARRRLETEFLHCLRADDPPASPTD